MKTAYLDKYLNLGFIKTWRFYLQRGYLICFTGVDGSGKTTHAKSLLRFLEYNGYPCKYVRGALRPILSYAFFIFTRLIGYWKSKKQDAFTNPLENAPQGIAKKLAALLRFLFFIDFHIKTLLKIRLPLVFGKTLICDRYFYDLLMELELNNISSKFFAYILSRTLPRPIIVFLMDAPATTIKSRRNFSLEEIKLKRRTFLRMYKNFNFIIINSQIDYWCNQKRIQKLTLSSISHN
jgi:dTMP kinase